MNKQQQLLQERFSEKIKFSEEYLNKYGRDWYQGLTPSPIAIFFPENEEDVINIIDFASKNKLKIVISGGRTGLNGGATAADGEIVLSTEKLNKIEWNEENNEVVCQPGVITDNAKKFVEEKGRLLPIEFSSTSSSSIGGNVATNAAGAKFIKYGSTKDHVVSIDVILPSGKKIQLSKRSLKDATGPNLMEVFYGSEGVLGLITLITLKTYPIMSFKETVLIKSNNLNIVQSELISEENKLISSLEFWDQNCHALTEGVVDSDYVILLELVSQNKKEIEYFLENISESFGDSVSLLNSKQASKMWSARENIPVLLSDMNAYKLDICVPIKSLQKYLEDINALGLEVKIFAFGHLGDGNVHLNLVGDEKINQSKNKIYEITKMHSGSPSAEHGIGQRKKYIWKTFSDYSDKQELLKTLKKSMDPENIMGPKVFFD
tara:strand:+ start:132 stop:1433 length:1302 start_codon:yes stop_codon:yes gene_type:complete